MQQLIMWMGGQVQHVAAGATHVVATGVDAEVKMLRQAGSAVLVQPGWVEECWIRSNDPSGQVQKK